MVLRRERKKEDVMRDLKEETYFTRESIEANLKSLYQLSEIIVATAHSLTKDNKNNIVLWQRAKDLHERLSAYQKILALLELKLKK